jgi:hypothetical protein
VLARGLATGLAAADDAAVAIGELAEQIEILVIDVHRTRTFAIDANRILLGDLLHAAGRLTLKHNLGGRRPDRAEVIDGSSGDGRTGALCSPVF